MYYQKNSQDPHLLFIGRWCPLHSGHTWIIEQKLEENPGMPVLVLVRDTAFDEINAVIRAKLVELWMKEKKIEGKVIIIPDIEGVYYGRGVGYNVDEIQPPENIKAISATKIRELIKAGDDSWKEIVAPGTADFVKQIYNA